MRRPEFIARQSACPSGFFGHVLARVMAVETAPENDITLDLLELVPKDAVLEIGFGHGHTIARAAERANQGLVAGVLSFAGFIASFCFSRSLPST